MNQDVPTAEAALREALAHKARIEAERHAQDERIAALQAQIAELVAEVEQKSEINERAKLRVANGQVDVAELRRSRNELQNLEALLVDCREILHTTKRSTAQIGRERSAAQEACEKAMQEYRESVFADIAGRVNREIRDALLAAYGARSMGGLSYGGHVDWREFLTRVFPTPTTEERARAIARAEAAWIAPLNAE